MKRKIIYSLIASVMFVAPIWYWLTTWWGLSMSRPPSLRRIVYIYSNDNTIVTITAINIVLYLFAMWKILTMQNVVRSNVIMGKNGNGTSNNSIGKNVPPIPNMMQNNNITDISKWEKLYGEKAKARVNTLTASSNSVEKNTPIQQQNTNTQVQKNNIVNEQPPLKPRNTITQSVATTSPQQMGTNADAEKTSVGEKSNIVNIAPVTANDVYRIQVKNMLSDGGYTSLGNCVVNGVDVDFVAVAESDTFVVGIIDSEYGEIVAGDTTPVPETPNVWYSGEHRYNSPVWLAKNVAVNVKKMIDEVLPNDNGINVVPVVVIPNATVKNLTEVSGVWQEMGVNVVRFMNKTELPDLMDVLPDKTGTELLDSYKTFAVTLMKYFNGKSGGKTKKVAN